MKNGSNFVNVFAMPVYLIILVKSVTRRIYFYYPLFKHTLTISVRQVFVFNICNYISRLALIIISHRRRKNVIFKKKVDTIHLWLSLVYARPFSTIVLSTVKSVLISLRGFRHRWQKITPLLRQFVVHFTLLSSLEFVQ